MADNLDSNITRKLLRKFLPAFDSARVLSKGVNTQLISGQFNPSTGDKVDVKRPHDYTSFTDATGDLTSSTSSALIAGKATATVQEWRTVWVEYNRLQEAIELDQKGKPGELQSIFGPMATRLATDLERDYAAFISKNAGLLSGTYGTAVSTWDHVADAGAVMQANGVPMDKAWKYYVNPFTQRALASDQRSLGSGSNSLVDTAHEKALITRNFAGMDVFTANTLPTYSSEVGADRAGAIDTNPVVTYLAAKDTMTQSVAITGFQANLQIRAGEVIRISGRFALDKSTRDPIIDETGAKVPFTAVVTADALLDGSGDGTIIIAGPAIFEAAGAYNTVDSAIVATDVITLLGAASTTFQPNLFWHPDAFTLGFVDIPKLHGMDNSVVNVDGISMRMALDGNLIQNKQVLRVDILPAYGVMNPFMAGKSFG
ncbi:MAG: hypothetical protein COB09_17090 [Thalassobium sp.]|nr:MAG: hypothetical protein COB09_17090 [Thalassobium sp.]